MKKTLIYSSIFFFITSGFFLPQSTVCQNSIQTSMLMIARIHYNGGGDWYNDPSIIPNLCRFIQSNTFVEAEDREIQVSLEDNNLFAFPILFITGHGRIVFNNEEAQKLKLYLLRGGFLYADDDYGMDPFFRTEMKKVFPDREWIELPFSHGIYSVYYHFENGLPKIHEHDKKPPVGYGILDDLGRLMVFYSYESNISDGWADPEVHLDPPEKRESALKMGTNIVIWALLN